MPLSNEPSEKTVPYFYRQNNFKSSSAFGNVSVHSTKSTDLGILFSLQRSDTCRHSKRAKTIKWKWKQTSKINEVSAKRNRNPYLREYMKKRRTDEGRMQKSNNRNSSVLSGLDDQKLIPLRKTKKNNVTVR